MLSNIVKKIITYMLNQKVITEDLCEVYQYGFELLLSSLITSSTIMIIACFMDSFWVGILYFIVSIPLKLTVGGYHASTYLGCFLISNLEYLIISLLSKILYSYSNSPFIWIVLLFISSGFIGINCPVCNSHHPVSESILHKNRMLALSFLSLECFITTCLYLLLKQSYILNFIVLSILAIAVFILPVQNERRKNDEFTTNIKSNF